MNNKKPTIKEYKCSRCKTTFMATPTKLMVHHYHRRVGSYYIPAYDAVENNVVNCPQCKLVMAGYRTKSFNDCVIKASIGFLIISLLIALSILKYIF